ncbi:dienelactone hydrolase [Macrophomina phaseolina]|uniref:Dienelactone hydrolase n=1 Tax=Macrophomina phaseolina TaxID=35725 RepID=A0ABQ8FV30_9PEZI|nr:dienelactone hydrolase [Macrophomina phaseolina]
MDPVLAKPADLCCLKGAIHSGEPQGTVEDIEGVATYVATPKADTSNRNIILFFPDAFGLHINSFLMIDAFAACGYLTLGVDYFLGDAVGKHSKTPLNDPNFDFEAWKTKHLTSTETVAAKWVKDVQAKYGKPENVKYACVGYCWGARFVCSQLSKAGICKVGAIAHPSFMNESHVFGVNAPIFFSVPNTDKLFAPEQRNRAVEIMTKGEKSFNMQIFSNVGHGFATRAHLSNPYERWAKEQSFKSFVEWFDFWLSVE